MARQEYFLGNRIYSSFALMEVFRNQLSVISFQMGLCNAINGLTIPELPNFIQKNLSFYA
jgi:hypothetical protein